MNTIWRLAIIWACTLAAHTWYAQKIQSQTQEILENGSIIPSFHTPRQKTLVSITDVFQKKYTQEIPENTSVWVVLQREIEGKPAIAYYETPYQREQHGAFEVYTGKGEYFWLDARKAADTLPGRDDFFEAVLK